VLGRLAAADRGLLVFMRTAGHSPAAERAVRRFSALGEHGAVWIAVGAAGAVLDRSRRRSWQRGAAVVAGSYLLNTAIKLVARRRRPELPGLPPLVATPTRLTFPSAHATTSFAGAGAYGALIPRPPLYALATALALSRPYLGVHYPSDTLAGALLGMLAGGLAR
jgi:membrane-associated phospholipid phosphatase